jgi:capsular polysaccharide biosynthesis protein
VTSGPGPRAVVGGLGRAVSRHAALVGVAALLGAAAGIGAAQLAPTGWSADATLLVRVQSPGSGLAARSQFAQQRVSSYAELGTSPEVLAPVAADLGVPVDGLAERVSVVNPGGTAVLRVHATSSTPEAAATLADDVAESLSAVVDRVESRTGAGGQTVALDLSSPASVPTSPDEPGLALTVLSGLLAGLLAGLAVGLAAALVLARARPTVDTVDDVRRLTGLPVVGQLPGTLRHDDSGTDASSARTRTALREVVQNTRTLCGGSSPSTLLLARTDAVREAMGVDGGLARAVVELGATCALVQSDFDARTLARPSTVPDGAVPEEVEGDRHGYDRVPVPDGVVASSRRHVRSGTHAFFTALREDYDVAVVQASSESHPLSLRSVTAEADGVLLVVRSGVTTVESLRSLSAELLSLDVEPVGVVMTGVPPWRRVLVRATWLDDDVRAVPEQSPPSFSIADLVDHAGAPASGRPFPDLPRQRRRPGTRS